MTGQSTGQEQAPARHFVRGMWTDGPDLVMDTWRAAEWKGDEPDHLRTLGYHQVFSIGRRINGGFEVWRRNETPRHVIAFEEEELTEYLYVDALPDLMTICAQWSTLVRDIEICEFLTEIGTDEHRAEAWTAPRDGLVETIARRAVQGTQQAYRHRGERD